MAARRTDTTPSGSYVALRINAAELAGRRMSGILAQAPFPASMTPYRNNPRSTLLLHVLMLSI